MDLPTRLNLYNTGRQYILQRATKIDPQQVDTVGTDANIFVGSNSVIADKIVKQLGYSIARMTLDGANGDDLDRYALDRYTETRKGASAAVGTVRMFRTSAGAGGGTIPAGTLLLTTGGTQYITTTAATFGISDLDGIFADVRAVQAGKASQVGAQGITRFQQPSLNFDTSIQVINDATTAGGEEVEDDDTFRERLRSFWLNARRGILSAIEQGATSVPGVVSAQAIEAISGGGLPARVINLYIADSTGVASQALARQVTTALLDYRAGGIAVIVSTSIPQIEQVQLALSFASGVDTVTLGQLVISAIVSFINSLPVNGTLLLADLYSVLNRFRANGLIPNQSSIVAPTGDIVPAVGQTIRATPASVTLVTPGS